MVSALLLVLVTLWAYPTCPSDFGLGAVPGSVTSYNLCLAAEAAVSKRTRLGTMALRSHGVDRASGEEATPVAWPVTGARVRTGALGPGGAASYGAAAVAEHAGHLGSTLASERSFLADSSHVSGVVTATGVCTAVGLMVLMILVAATATVCTKRRRRRKIDKQVRVYSGGAGMCSVSVFLVILLCHPIPAMPSISTTPDITEAGRR